MLESRGRRGRSAGRDHEIARAEPFYCCPIYAIIDDYVKDKKRTEDVMRVTREEVERIASLSMLSLDDEKKLMLQKNLDDILEHAEKLNELDTKDVEPTSYILKQQNVVREDVPGKVWSREEMLKNASEQEDGCFVVPKVVD